MPTSTPDSDQAGIDPDDAPHLTKEFFDNAEIREAGRLVQAGRTRTEQPREQISVRLDVEVLARLREHGPGWQSRMNSLLRQALGLDAPAVVPTADLRRVLEEIDLLRNEVAGLFGAKSPRQVAAREGNVSVGGFNFSSEHLRLA